MAVDEDGASAAEAFAAAVLGAGEAEVEAEEAEKVPPRDGDLPGLAVDGDGLREVSIRRIRLHVQILAHEGRGEPAGLVEQEAEGEISVGVGSERLADVGGGFGFWGGAQW